MTSGPPVSALGGKTHCRRKESSVAGLAACIHSAPSTALNDTSNDQPAAINSTESMLLTHPTAAFIYVFGLFLMKQILPRAFMAAVLDYTRRTTPVFILTIFARSKETGLIDLAR